MQTKILGIIKKIVADQHFPIITLILINLVVGALVVTDYGVAVNPKSEYYKKLMKAKKDINFIKIEELRDIAYNLVGGAPDPIPFTDRIVAIIEHRDGTILDVVHQIKE